MIRSIRISPIWAVTLIEREEFGFVRYFFTKREEDGQINIKFDFKTFEWDFKKELTDEKALDIITEKGIAL